MKVGKDGWLTLDPNADMTPEARELYVEYKAAYRLAQEAKAKYEAAMSALAPAGKALVFGYNFGQASIKIVEATERQAKRVAKPQMSLAEYLAAQGMDGRQA